MRTDCKHYESRTYATGEAVQKCNLDLAPEAPWRCPDDCPAYARRLVDYGWQWGKLQTPKAPVEPPKLGEDTAALLDAAEDIVNAAGPDILEEFKRLDDKRNKRWLGRLPKPKGKKRKK